MPTFKDWVAGRTAEAGGDIVDADEFYLRDDSGDVSKRVTYSGLKTALASQYVPGTIVALGADATVNSTNFQAAITANQGTDKAVYLPAGDYEFDSTVTITNRIRIVGSGKRTTFLRPASTLSDPLIIVDDCWRTSGNESVAATTTVPATNKAGVTITDLAIVGDRANSAAGIRCTGRNDNLSFERVFLGYLNGTALYLGHGTLGLVRESVFRDVTVRGCGDGSTGHAVIVTTGDTVGDGTNQLHFDNLEVVYPHGVGLHLTSDQANTATRRINFTSLMLHGGDDSEHVMVIDANVDSTVIDGMRGNGTEVGYAVIHIGQRLSRDPGTISIAGDIRQTDIGILVDNVNSMRIDLTAQAASITDSVVTFSADSVGGTCWLSVLGASPSIDASVLDRVTGVWDDKLSTPQPRLYLPGVSGNFDSTPDNAAFNVTDFTIMVWASLPDWSTGGIITLVGKYLTAGNQRSFRLAMNATGLLRLDVSSDGTAGGNTALSSTVPIPYADGAGGWLAATYDADNGASGKTARFFTATGPPSVTPDTWTQFGADVVSATAVTPFDSTAALEVGASDGGTINLTPGTFGRALVLSDIGVAGIPGSTVIADRRYDVPVSPYRDSTGKLWTLAGSAVGWTL